MNEFQFTALVITGTIFLGNFIGCTAPWRRHKFMAKTWGCVS